MQVHIEEAKDLLAADRGGTSDPFVRLSVLDGPGGRSLDHSVWGAGKKKAPRTKTVKKTLNPVWEDERHEMHQAPPPGAVLLLSLFDEDLLGADKLGQVVVSLDDVPVGGTFEQWLPVTNSPGMKAQATGELKVLVHRGQEGETGADVQQSRFRAQLEAMAAEFLDHGPPPNELRIAVVQARQLKVMDKSMFSKGGSSDPLVTLTCAGLSQKTSVKKKCLDPVWHEVFSWEIENEAAVVRVVVDDWDQLSGNDFIGQVELPVAKLARTKHEPARRWYPLLPKSGKLKDRKGDEGELELWAMWGHNPTLHPAFFDDVPAVPDRLPNELLVAVCRAKELVAMDKSMFGGEASSDPLVHVACGQAKAKTSIKKKTLEPRWNEAFTLPAMHRDHLGSAANGGLGFGEVVLTMEDWDLVSSNDFMGEVRIPLTALADQRTIKRWFFLQPKSSRTSQRVSARSRSRTRPGSAGSQTKDAANTPPQEQSEQAQQLQSQGDVDARGDGVVDADVTAAAADDALAMAADAQRGRLEVVVKWVFNPEREPEFFCGDDDGRPDKAPNELRVALVQARGLPVMDKKLFGGPGSSDPLVKLRCGVCPEQRSEVIKKNLNPIWNQVFHFEVHSLASSLDLEVEDWDHLSGNDFMGSVVLPLEGLHADGPDKPGLADRAPQRLWLPLSELTVDKAKRNALASAAKPIKEGADDQEKLGAVELVLHWWYNPDKDHTVAFFEDLSDSHPDNKPNRLKVAVACARDLLIMDKSLFSKGPGSSDPFARLRLNGGKFVRRQNKQKWEKTSVKKTTLMPVWNEEFEFDVDDLSAVLELELMDWDLAGTNDFMGHLLVPLAPFADKQVHRQWFPIVDRPKNVDKVATAMGAAAVVEQEQRAEAAKAAAAAKVETAVEMAPGEGLGVESGGEANAQAAPISAPTPSPGDVTSTSAVNTAAANSATATISAEAPAPAPAPASAETTPSGTAATTANAISSGALPEHSQPATPPTAAEQAAAAAAAVGGRVGAPVTGGAVVEGGAGGSGGGGGGGAGTATEAGAAATAAAAADQGTDPVGNRLQRAKKKKKKEKPKRGMVQLVFRWIYDPELDPVYFTDLADEDKHPDRAPNQLKIALVRASGLLAVDKKSILSRDTRGGSSDPVVTFELAGNKEQSTVKKKNLDPIWNETFAMPVDDISSQLTVLVEDWDRASSNDFLGRVVLPMELLRERVPQQRWFPLGGPNEEDLVDEVQNEEGVWEVVKPADIERGQVELALHWWHNPNLDPEFFVGDDDGYPKRPPNELRVAVVRGIDLLPMDVNLFGRATASDPYVILKCGAVEVKTAVQRQTLDPRWREVLTLPVSDPEVDLEVDVYDWDRVGAHDFMGRVVIPIEPLADKQRDQEWHVLGGKDGAEDGVSRGELELALHWWFNPKLEPDFFVDEPDIARTREPNLLKFAVIRAQNLPAVDKGLFGVGKGSCDPVVRIELGSEKEQKTAVKKKQLDPVWNQEFSFATEDKTGTLVFHIEDYNLVKNTKIGTVRVPLAPFHDRHLHRQWFPITAAGTTPSQPNSRPSSRSPSPVPASAALSAAEGEAATSQQGHLVERDQVPAAGQIELAFKWTFDPKLSPTFFDGPDEYPDEDLNELCVAAIQARGLPAMDRKLFSAAGSSDPMVVFRVGKKNKVKTKVMKRTLTPKWHEALYMPLTAEEGLTAEFLEIDVLDWDLTSNDFIGRVKVPLEPLAEHRMLEHRWYDLGNEHGEVNPNAPRGQIEVALRWHYEPTRDPEFKVEEVFPWEDPDPAKRRAQILAHAAERFSLDEGSPELMLRRNEVDREGAVLISAVVSLEHTSLTKVDLRESKLSEDDILALAKQLGQATVLQHLNISRNCMQDTRVTSTQRSIPKPVAELGRALARNAVLAHLDLSESHIEPLGLHALSQGLQVNGALRVLSLRENPLCQVNKYGRGEYEVEGIVALSRAVKLHCSLEMLNLGQVQLCGLNASNVGVYQTNGLVELLDALRMNRTIKQLDLSGNAIVEAGGAALVQDSARTGHFATRTHDRSKRPILVLERHLVVKPKHTEFKSF